MKTRFPAVLAAAMVAGSMAGAGRADGGMTVQLPDVSALSEAEAKALIAQLAQVNVITSNCPGYAISDGEWTLVTGTGDRLAARLGLDAASYDRAYYGPAFKLLDAPGDLLLGLALTGRDADDREVTATRRAGARITPG